MKTHPISVKQFKTVLLHGIGMLSPGSIAIDIPEIPLNELA